LFQHNRPGADILTTTQRLGSGTTCQYRQAKSILQGETLEAVADRGYFRSREILACHEADITVALPKPATSGAKSEGASVRLDFAYLSRRTLIAHLAPSCSSARSHSASM